MQPREITTEDEARTILGLPPDAPLAAWRPAFNLAIKAVHPDLGGDGDQACKVLEAYRLLRTIEAQRHRYPIIKDREADVRQPLRSLVISVEEAFGGVKRAILLHPGQSFMVRLPPGLRTGDHVCFDTGSNEAWVVDIAAQSDREVRGSALWLHVPVSSVFLRTGGSLTVDTPGGEQRLWVTRKMVASGIVAIQRAGLPARDVHPAGDAFIRLCAAKDKELYPPRLRRTALAG